MKVWVYVDDYDQVKLHNRKGHDDDDKPTEFIGTLDLDIKQEKKWVKKEVDVELADKVFSYDDKKMVSATWVPMKAKNFHLTYEVEE